ncbi:uncharacterized protein LOC132457512 isoform X3 [Gadus macrocephalus]|uniref:uncharacterized protein LOC132457512 isoform X3 n=1 Tax=Gadus macrocephalus TaxID=80720 RepID=UPI0028CBBF81|nr:uncharacterized protein LOC132457512 isoform X3 [Gadus macrocephalus]
MCCLLLHQQEREDILDALSGPSDDEDRDNVPKTSGEDSSDEEPIMKNVQTRCRKTYTAVRGETEPSSSGSLGVSKVKKRKDGSKNYHAKRNFCLYCEKSYAKIARHLEQKHSRESEVASALACPKKSKERRVQLDFIRRKGNPSHNIDVIKEGKGIIVPCKQSSSETLDPKDYMHCANCQGLFKRKFLWKHNKVCTLAQKSTRTGRTRIQALCANAQPIPNGVSSKVWEMINNMFQDEIADTVKKDKVIIALGEQMFNKKGGMQQEHTRQTLRELGRLVLAGRKVTPLTKIEQYVMPSNMDHLIKAVKIVAGFDEEKNVFKKSNLALKLGHSLKKIADLVTCEALIAGHKEKANSTEDFLQIYKTRWNEYVSASAYRSLHEAKWNAPQLIPFTEDVKKMHLYSDDKQKEYSHVLSGDQTSKNWTKLAQVILTRVILFNRRREGEVSKMFLTMFSSRTSTPLHDDVAHALSDIEKQLCKYFTRIEIRGKRGRKVPVLLTPAVVESLELLTKQRSACGVPANNHFLFARPGTVNHLRGSDAIRLFARVCGAQRPDSLSSSKLRKQVSTLSKVLNLNDTELDQLADFLGHDIRIHRQYYRLPEGTLQLAKISKILMACEQGRLAEFKGKSLEEISIEPNETVEIPSTSPHAELQDADEDPTPGGSPQPAGSPLPARPPLPAGSTLPAAAEISEVSRSSQSTKRKWTQIEVAAIEAKMGRFIREGKTPGKEECQECIASSPEALKSRDWRAVKFFVRNRIVSLSRKTFK